MEEPDTRPRADALWRLAATITPTVEVPLRGGITAFVSTRDHEIGRSLFVRGAFERDALLRANAILREQGSGLEGRIMVDVGANIGTASLHALVECGVRTSFAFEPARENFKLLCVNIAANGLTDRVIPIRTALTDHDGEAWLELRPGNSGANTLVAEERTTGPCEQISLSTFDSWRRSYDVERVPLEHSVVWIDVEGSEYRVLSGATDILAATPPLVLEYCPPHLGTDAEPLQVLLAQHYRMYQDLRNPDSEPQPVTSLHELRGQIETSGHILTDILVWK